MATTDIKNAIEQYVTNKLITAVGIGTDPANFVKTFDNHIHNLENLDNFPFVVVNAPKKTNSRGEIGTVRELEDWELNVYYLDIAQYSKNEDYEVGRQRRDFICNQIEYILESDPQLGNLRVPILGGQSTAYVYDLVFNEVIFNDQGQDGGWSFTCEMYGSVNVAKN